MGTEGGSKREPCLVRTRTVMDEPGLTYEEFAAPSALGAHVRCLWHLQGDGTGSPPEPIVPDGCAEIVLNFSDPFLRHDGGDVERQPLELCAGPLSRAIHIQPSGRIDIWGIRFHPWSAARFIDASATELRDHVPALGDVSTPLRTAFDAVRDMAPERRHDALTDALSRRAAKVETPDGLLPATIDRIMTRPEQLSVRLLAREFGSSVRRLQSLFERNVGLPPKLLTRIARFQRALAVARGNPSMSWSAVAHAAAYYDHAHFVHDSHDLVGCPPSALAAREAGLTEVFLSDGEPQ
jgi:AraC-like DNA-binding protein